MQNAGEKDWWKPLLAMGAAVINKSKYGTAMDSILIMVALVTVPSLIVYAFIRFWLLLLIACVPIFYFIRAYDYYMKNNPKMLRTEKHEETMLRIASSLGQKGKELTEEVIDALPAVTARDTSTNKPELISAKAGKGKK